MPHPHRGAPAGLINVHRALVKHGAVLLISQTIARAWRWISPRAGLCARSVAGGFWAGADALGGGRCGPWMGCGGCTLGAGAAGRRRLGRRTCCCRTCACCGAVAWCEVIGAAVLLSASGAGYRQVAEQLGRPAETVGDWPLALPFSG